MAALSRGTDSAREASPSLSGGGHTAALTLQTSRSDEMKQVRTLGFPRTCWLSVQTKDAVFT